MASDRHATRCGGGPARARVTPIAPALWVALAAAPFVGSLLGVLIRRLPAGRPIGLARSCCDSCGRTLGSLELIPLASYLALRGCCRHCGARIGRFHPAVELAALAVPACLAVAGIQDAPWVAAGCLLGWGLLALGWIDVENFLLPDVLTLPLLLAGLLQAWFWARDELAGRVLGAVLGYLSLILVNWSYRRLRGRDGLGQGDAKLFAAGGAWAGAVALPDILLVGAVLGLVMAGVMALRGLSLTATSRLAFGAPLAAGIWVVWLLG